MKHFDVNKNSGMSLVSVLISLAIMGIISFTTFSWLANYQKGRAKLAALNSVGEVERVITSAIGQSIQSYVRKGCSNGTAANTGISLLNQKRTLSSFGELVRAKKQKEITLTAPSSGQQAYIDASAALKNCPEADPATGTSKKFKTCFRFIPDKTSGSVASKAGPSSILKANLVFVYIESDILNLRDGTGLTCGQVIDKTGLIKCTITGGCSAYSESSFPGSGVQHYYKVFWDLGSGGNRTYNSKEGKIYVPN